MNFQNFYMRKLAGLYKFASPFGNQNSVTRDENGQIWIQRPHHDKAYKLEDHVKGDAAEADEKPKEILMNPYQDMWGREIRVADEDVPYLEEALQQWRGGHYEEADKLMSKFIKQGEPELGKRRSKFKAKDILVKMPRVRSKWEQAAFIGGGAGVGAGAGVGLAYLIQKLRKKKLGWKAGLASGIGGALAGAGLGTWLQSRPATKTRKVTTLEYEGGEAPEYENPVLNAYNAATGYN